MDERGVSKLAFSRGLRSGARGEQGVWKRVHEETANQGPPKKVGKEKNPIGPKASCKVDQKKKEKQKKNEPRKKDQLDRGILLS